MLVAHFYKRFKIEMDVKDVIQFSDLVLSVLLFSHSYITS